MCLFISYVFDFMYFHHYIFRADVKLRFIGMKRNIYTLNIENSVEYILLMQHQIIIIFLCVYFITAVF